MSHVLIRQATPSDIQELLELQHECYPMLSTVSLWRREHLEAHQRNFPDGQFVADLDGRLVGHCATFITHSARALQAHTFRDITARGTFDTHDSQGDTLYGAEIMVHPDMRRRGIGKQFYQARFELARRLNLRYFAAGGRLPGFGKAPADLSPEAYVKAVADGKMTDRVLSAQIKSGLRPIGVLPHYLNDPNSKSFASLLVWDNPDYRPFSPARRNLRAPRGVRRP